MAVTFRQWVDPFDSETEETGCTLTADAPSISAVVTSVIASASDTADRATANITAGSKLPSGDQGRLRVKFTTPNNNLTANAVFLALWKSAGPILEFYLTLDVSEVALFSPANTFRSTSLNTPGTTQLSQGTEYTIEIAWKGATDATGFRRIWLNESLEFEDTGLDMVTAGDCTPTEFRIGCDHYDGSDPEGFTTTYRLFQLADDPTTALSDPTAKQSFYVARRRMVVR